MNRLREMIEDGRIHIFDGAMGTVLYERGIFVSVCYDALAVEQPELVEAVHAEYVRSGAEIIETNTFGANPVKLSAYGLESRTEELNEAAARVAVRAASGAAAVVGAVGPLGIRIEPLGPTAVEEAEEHFARQIRGLVAGGVDGILLETFANLDEVGAAVRAARAHSELPVIAQMTVGEDLRTSYGSGIEALVERLEELEADVIGLNCSVGPARMTDGIEAMSALTDRPLSAQPNAGLPRTVGDRKIYLAAPDYVGRYARRTIEAGARFVGGCCGTTPEHIRRIRDQVASLQPRSSAPAARRDRVVVSPVAKPEEPRPAPRPRAERSPLGAALDSGAFLRTVELLPPRGPDPTPTLELARAAAAAGADAISLVDSARSPGRMAAIAAATIIEAQVSIPTIVHYTCRDRNVLGMMSDLLGASASGIRNLLAVTGDPPRAGPYPESTAVFDIDSIGLVNLVAGLNRGIDAGGNALGASTDFLIGVALNQGARDLDRELERLRWKVEAGADYIVTQPVFEVEDLIRVLDRIADFRIPVLAGVWPLGSLRAAEFLANEVPGVAVSARVIERMRSATARGADFARAEGLDLAREVLEAIEGLVEGVHLSGSEGGIDNVLTLLEEGVSS